MGDGDLPFLAPFGDLAVVWAPFFAAEPFVEAAFVPFGDLCLVPLAPVFLPAACFEPFGTTRAFLTPLCFCCIIIGDSSCAARDRSCIGLLLAERCGRGTDLVATRRTAREAALLGLEELRNGAAISTNGSR